MESTVKTVSVRECQTYAPETVNQAILAAVDDLGGISKFVRKGMRVFIKPNLVTAAVPERCATTHPAVVAAVAELVKSVGGHAIIGDSPGGPFNNTFLNGVYRKCGMTEAAEITGAELNRDFSDVTAEFPAGAVAKKIPVLKAIDEADIIINIAKLKTHSFAGFSGACKNMYGVIPGLVKVQWHQYFQDLERFSNCLIDINEYFKSKGKLVLHIVDAVDGMEGPGPTSGTPVHVGLVMASECYSSLDCVCVRLMDDKPEHMPTLYTAVERGLLNDKYEVNIVGDAIQPFINKKYKRTPPSKFNLLIKSPILRWLARKVFSARPVVSVRKCKGCGKCSEHCPVQAITMRERNGRNSSARFDYDKCIRCYCCQELCPFNLVKVKRPLVARFIERSRKNKIKAVKSESPKQ